MKKADAYREALMAGLSPDNAYEPDLVLLQEAYDQKGPEKGFDYIRDVQGQRSRKNTEVRDEWTRTPSSGGTQVSYLIAALNELEKVRREYDEVYRSLLHVEFELFVVKTEARSIIDPEWLSAARNQEERSRAWQEETVREKLAPLHQRIFELDKAVSSKRQAVMAGE